jgi:hypothetical protein
MNEENTKPPLVVHAPETIELLSSHQFNPSYKKSIDSYNEKVFKMSDTEVSSRIINSWESLGLLVGKQNKESKWRKFSLIEILWIEIIKELRKLGFSSEKILNVKNSIFKINEKYGKTITATFGVYLLSINAHRDIILIIDNEGNSDMAMDFEYEMSQRVDEFPNTHIVISLNKVYSDFTRRPEFRKRNQDFYIYSKQELEILSAIYLNPDIKEITIKPENTSFGKLDFKYRKTNPSDVVDLVRKAVAENKRKELRITIEPNKVTLFEETKKT